MRIIRKLIISSLLLLLACNDKPEIEKEIEKIQVDLKVKRFDRDFAATTERTLSKTKLEYPYLFPESIHDSIWIGKLRDTLQLQLNREVEKAFSNFGPEKNELEKMFRHVRYYTPEVTIPTVVTVTSFVDYRRKVIYADSLLLISLDTYLGENHTFYEGIQQYIRKNLSKSQIIPDVSEAVSATLLPSQTKRSFIAQMVRKGKQLYYTDLVAPWLEDHTKIGYTREELQWAMANEAEMWRYFVDRKLLFNTDQKLKARFLEPTPFSKFYLELDTESPGRVGAYIGWQIVRAFMENNDVPLHEMFAEPEESLFIKSGFKPRKNG